MKLVEIVLRRGEGKEGEENGGGKSKTYVSTYINITMYPPVQLLYANKNNF
jgi:hypothetical protein